MPVNIISLLINYIS